jgi:hypothetical protein
MGHTITYTRRGKARHGKDCRRCGGHGIRIRRGRHLYNLWHRTYTRGTDTPRAAGRATDRTTDSGRAASTPPAARKGDPR